MTTNAEIDQRRNDSVARALAYSSTFVADRAQGAEVWDVEGNRYIDFATDCPVPILAVFTTDPTPVTTAQPKRAATSKGILGSIFTRAFCEITAYSLKAATPEW